MNKVSKYVHLTVIKCPYPLSFWGLRPLTTAGALALDPTPIYSTLYLIVNTLPSPRGGDPGGDGGGHVPPSIYVGGDRPPRKI